MKAATTRIVGQQTSPNALATLQVSVLDATSGKSILGAEVKLVTGTNPLLGGQDFAAVQRQLLGSKGLLAPPTPNVRTLNTDGTGSSVFHNIEPGSYRISASADGYLDGEYGSAIVGKAGTVLSVATGANAVELRLTPAASVEGVVTTTEARAVPGLPVYLVRPSFVPDGYKLIAVKQTASDGTGRFK